MKFIYREFEKSERGGSEGREKGFEENVRTYNLDSLPLELYTHIMSRWLD